MVSLPFASIFITVDPIWPWDAPIFGLPALAIVATVLAGLTIWTYLRVEKITRGQLVTILCLRLAALVVACLLVLRPALARQDDESIMPTKLLILVDASKSMNIEDDFNNKSRWENARRILNTDKVKKARKNLAEEHKVDILFYQGTTTGVSRFDPDDADVEAIGQRTDFGTWLHDIWQLHGRDGNLRGLLIFSDGADNGTRYELQLTRWANVCPIYTFALGKTSTSSKNLDIALTDIAPPREPLPVKTQFTVSALIDAWGFKNTPVDVWLEIHDPATGEPKMVGRPERITLRKDERNEVSLTRDVPDVAGEYKITMKVDKLPGEVTHDNNQISSYITVTKEGVSILWVDGHKRLESPFVLRYALAKEKRFRFYPAEKLADVGPGKADWYNLKQQKYDVIVIGDISASRFASGQQDVFRKIKDLVTREGTGLMFMGGHESFGNSDWASEPDILSLMPVSLDARGQVEGSVRMVPTRDGLTEYLLKLDDDPVKNKAIWDKVFDPLDGMTRLGQPKDRATIYAVSDRNEPVLVGQKVGEGRVLAFAADTTWKSWRRSPEAVKAFERFWIRTMLWLARQENLEGSAYVKPDVRRVIVAQDRQLGFEVGLKGTGGVKIENATYEVKVFGPKKFEAVIPTKLDNGLQRGSFEKIHVPGEYRIEVVAKGIDLHAVDGKPKEIEGKASARFLIVTEDLESRRPAADHDFLGKLARAGGGYARQADERPLLELLEEIKAQKQKQPHVDRWPDWRRNPPPPLPGQPSTVGDQLWTLWNSAALPCLMLFISFLSLEWYLRRRWDLV